MPGRHHEDIFCTKAEGFIADDDLPATFHHMVDGAVSGTRNALGKPFRQQLQESAHRRHRIAAGDRVDVAHFVAIPLVGIAQSG